MKPEHMTHRNFAGTALLFFMLTGAGCVARAQTTPPITSYLPPKYVPPYEGSPIESTLFSLGTRAVDNDGLVFEIPAKLEIVQEASSSIAFALAGHSSKDRITLTVNRITKKEYDTHFPNDVHYEFPIHNGSLTRINDLGQQYLININANYFKVRWIHTGKNTGEPSEADIEMIMEKIKLSTERLPLPVTGPRSPIDTRKPISAPTPTHPLPTPITPTTTADDDVASEAPKSILERNGRPNGFDTPTDPTNPRFSYLSYSNPEGDAAPSSTAVNSIWRYDTLTSVATPIYQETSTTGALRIVSIEGAHLILLRDTGEEAFGACTDLWYGHEEHFFYLDVRAPANGLRPYSVPSEKLSTGKNRQEACLRALHS